MGQEGGVLPKRDAPGSSGAAGRLAEDASANRGARRRWAAGLTVCPLVLTATLAVMTGSAGSPVRAALAVPNSNFQGFDGCQKNPVTGKFTSQPSVSQMSAFFRGTSLWQYYLYLGGSDALCGGPNSGVSASWVGSVLTQGWGLVGIWVGPQCCSNTSGWIPYNLTSARSLGVSQANGAIAQAISWGLSEPFFPVVYDFESTPSNGVAAENAFLGGWDSQIDAEGFTAGAYGSTCGSGVENWAGASPAPSFVWPADYSHGSNSVWGLSCLIDGDWLDDQRHHQYRGGHNQSYNSVTLNTDSDCGNGPVVSEAGQTYGDQNNSGSEPHTVAGAQAEDGLDCNGNPT